MPTAPAVPNYIACVRQRLTLTSSLLGTNAVFMRMYPATAIDLPMHRRLSLAPTNSGVAALTTRSQNRTTATQIQCDVNGSLVLTNSGSSPNAFAWIACLYFPDMHRAISSLGSQFYPPFGPAMGHGLAPLVPIVKPALDPLVGTICADEPPLLVVSEAVAYVMTALCSFVLSMQKAVTVKLTPHHRRPC